MKYENFKKENFIAKSRIEIILKKRGAQTRSAWERGVYSYAIDLLENIHHVPNDSQKIIKLILKGADDWDQYSYGGCSLIYDCDIAKRLCNISELKITRNGDREPNKYETWLDVQARALKQSENAIISAVYEINELDYINAIIPAFLKNKENKQGIREYEYISKICYYLLRNIILNEQNKTVEFWKYHICGHGTRTYYSDTNYHLLEYREKFRVIENNVAIKKKQKYIVKIDMRKLFFKNLKKALVSFIDED
jgi:hypothetical protein